MAEVIVVTEPGKVMPEAFVDHMLEKCGVAFGAAVAQPGKQRPDQIKMMSVPEGIKKSDLMSFFAKRKDDRLFLWFSGKLKNKGDSQPWIVINGKDNYPIMVSLMDGDFLTSVEGRSGAFCSWEEYLAPKLQGLYQMFDGDVGKLINHIDNDKLISREIIGLANTRGVTTLMASTGWFRSFQRGNGETFKQFEWGWVSNPLGYAEGSFPEKKEDQADDGLDFLDSSTPATGKGEPVARTSVPVSGKTPADSGSPGGTGTPTTANGGDTAIPTAVVGTPSPQSLSGEIWVKPPGPPDIQGKPAIEAWYKRLLGHAPRNYKDRPAVKVTKARWAKFQEEEKEFQAREKAREATGYKPFTDPTKKDVDTKHIPAGKDYQPIVPAGEKQGFQDSFRQRGTVKKYLDRNSRDAMDPRAIGKMADDEHPPYHVAMDLDGLEVVFYWMPEDISEHVDKYPEASKVLIKDLARALSSAYDDLEKVTSPTEDNKLAQIS